MSVVSEDNQLRIFPKSELLFFLPIKMFLDVLSINFHWYQRAKFLEIGQRRVGATPDSDKGRNKNGWKSGVDHD